MISEVGGQAAKLAIERIKQAKDDIASDPESDQSEADSD